MINIATEASDSNLAFVKTAIYSFVKNNPQFDGIVYLLTSSKTPLSPNSLNQIKTVYQRVNIISADEFTQYPLINSGRLENLRYLVFAKRLENIFYFNSHSLFCKGVFDIFSTGKDFIDRQLNYFYFDQTSNLNFTNESIQFDSFFNSNQIESGLPENLVVDSISFLDSKFNQLLPKLKSARIIFYTNRTNKNTSKINQIWLQQHKEANTFASKPINRITKQTPQINLKNQSYSNNNNVSSNTTSNFLKSKLITTSDVSKYLENKKIAIVANSSDLLNDNYGELIDSHDIVVRFNGYKILPENTGQKTNIHCIFREAHFNLDLYSDYLFVLSKPIHAWRNSVHEILLKYPTKKIIDYHFPIYSQILSSFKKMIIPTTGLCFILFIESLNLKNNEISLFGFNGYQNGISSILRSNNSFSISRVHEYNIEMEYLKKKFQLANPYILTSKNNL